MRSTLQLRAVLAHTDLTSAADLVLRCAVRIARHGGATFHAVHGTGLIGAPLVEAAPRLTGEYDPAVRAALREQVTRAIPAGAEADSYATDHEAPWRALARRAARVAPDLVVAAPEAMTVRHGSPPDLSPGEFVRLTRTPLLIPGSPLRWPLARAAVLTVGEHVSGAPIAGALAWMGSGFEHTPGRRRAILRVVHFAADERGRERVAPGLTALVRRFSARAEAGTGIRVRKALRLTSSAEEAVLRIMEADGTEVLITSVREEERAGGNTLEAAMELARLVRCAILVLPSSAGEDELRRLAPREGRPREDEDRPAVVAGS